MCRLATPRRLPLDAPNRTGTHGNRTTSKPLSSRISKGSNTALCSICVVITWAPPRAASLGFQPEDRQIVGLGGARREQHLIRLRLHNPGDLCPGVLDSPLRPHPVVMRPGPGVPELRVQVLDDQIAHPRLDRSGGVAVEVSGHRGRLIPSVPGFQPSLCVRTDFDKQCYNENKLRSRGGPYARQHHRHYPVG